MLIDEILTSENNPEDAKFKDKYYLTRILFYIMGMMYLVPGNFFTTANDFWMYKFRNTNESYSSDNENRTSLQAEFTADYSLVSHTFLVIFIVLTIVFVKKIKLKHRLFGGMCIVLAVFVLTVIFVEINTDSWQARFFVATLILGGFLTASCAVIVVSLFELASRFPPIYVTKIVSGQAVCGIFSALVQIFALSTGASSLTIGLIYFLIGTLSVLLSFVYLILNLKKSDFFKHHFQKNTKITTPSFDKKIFVAVIKRVWIYITSMVISLASTASIYPGVMSLVVSVDRGNGNDWNDLYFVPVVTFLFYHTFDYLGRELALIIKKPSNSIAILCLTLLRVILVPLMVLCKTRPRHHWPILFDQDYPYIIFMILFAFSNGYILNLCTREVTHSAKEDEKMITYMFVLTIMLLTLGVFSFVTAALVKLL